MNQLNYIYRLAAGSRHSSIRLRPMGLRRASLGRTPRQRSWERRRLQMSDVRGSERERERRERKESVREASLRIATALNTRAGMNAEKNHRGGGEKSANLSPSHLDKIESV